MKKSKWGLKYLGNPAQHPVCNLSFFSRLIWPCVTATVDTCVLRLTKPLEGQNYRSALFMSLAKAGWCRVDTACSVKD